MDEVDTVEKGKPNALKPTNSYFYIASPWLSALTTYVSPVRQALYVYFTEEAVIS